MNRVLEYLSNDWHGQEIFRLWCTYICNTVPARESHRLGGASPVATEGCLLSTFSGLKTVGFPRDKKRLF
jgi:hypothetical protein